MMDLAVSPDEMQLPPERQGIPAPPDLIARRQSMRALAKTQIHDASAVARLRTIAGVPCIEVSAVNAQGALIYAHGGGFRMGEAAVWTGFASRLAVACGLRIIVPDYRLAPEHPFPAALRDLIAVFRAVCAEAPSKVFVGGDSAGGGLTCSLVFNALAYEVQAPAGVVVIRSRVGSAIGSNTAFLTGSTGLRAGSAAGTAATGAGRAGAGVAGGASTGAGESAASAGATSGLPQNPTPPMPRVIARFRASLHGKRRTNIYRARRLETPTRRRGWPIQRAFPP